MIVFVCGYRLDALFFTQRVHVTNNLLYFVISDHFVAADIILDFVDR